MRFRLVFGALISLLLFAIGGWSVPSGPQLTAVNVTPNGDTVVVTLRAAGPIVHNEYRPEDQLLMVDLQGVSPGTLKVKEKTVDLPALKSYRVLSYIGANGTENTRVELSLGENVAVKVEPGTASLDVRLTVKKQTTQAAAPAPPPASTAPSTPSAPVAVAKNPAPVAPTKTPTPAATAPVTTTTASVRPNTAASKPAPPPPVAKFTPAPANAPTVSHPTASGQGSVRDVLVKTGENGVEVTIIGVTSAAPLVLSGPDRLVLDFHGVAPSNKRNIPVNSSDVRSVRIAQFEVEPPVTRVVLDLVGKRKFDIVPLDDRIVVKIESAPGSRITPTATTPAAPSSAFTPPRARPVARGTEPAPTAPVTPPPQRKRETQTAAVKPQPQEPQVPLPDYSLVQPKYEKRTPGTQANAAAETIAGQAPGGAPGQQPEANPGAEESQQPGAPTASAQHRYTGEPISMNLKDVDLKDFFRLISDISGLNIVLDPSISGKETLVLNDVPWDQALDLVLENHGLDKMLEGNVLRIASVDTLKKEAEARALRSKAVASSVDTQTVTRILSYAHAKDVLPVIKKFLSERGDVMSDDRTNALIIRDIPSIMPVVDKIINQLDRKTQQVEIEARVVAAKRSFMRDLGVQLGFGWGNGPSQVGGSPSNPGSLIGTTTGPSYYQTSTGTIPLFSNNPAAAITSGLSFLNATKSYRIDAVLSMAESRGLLKVLSRPRIVTQNNVKAMVKQGTRLPIVTQGQLGGPNSVSYVDAFLRLEVTPQITSENTIFLNVDVENTQPDMGQAVQGNPALDTQQATTQVLVSDGATVVIGGVVQTTNTINITQTPLLGSIPLLGNLFKSRNVNTSTTELMFFITPKIVIY